MQERIQELKEQRAEILERQNRAIKAKRLLKNKDYKELILDQLKAEEQGLLSKISSPTDIHYTQSEKLSGIEVVRYLQGQIRTTRGLICYLDNILLMADDSEKLLVEIENELESIIGQPVSDNQ